MKKITKKIIRSTSMLSIVVMSLSGYVFGEDVVVMQKQKTDFAIDGNRGARQGQQIYLWSIDTENANQQWVENSINGGYHSYRKQNTNVCLDGGPGGRNRQAVTLELCDSNNQNQHWNKVSVTSGTFRLEKRGTSFSIDGNRGGDNRQAVYLWTSNSSNVNQQWQFLSQGSTSTPAPTATPSPTPTPTPEPNWTVSSLSELRSALTQSNQEIVMKAGHYSIAELPNNQRYFVISGNNNLIDLTDVHIEFQVDQTSEPHFTFLGSGNTLKDGTLENTYSGGLTTITNFFSYNEDRDNLANGADVHMKITGNNNTVIGTKMTVRGSFPFGYGSTFGIGRVNSFGLSKRGGIQIGGKNTVIDGIELYLEAFGHGIYMQSPADNTTIRNTLVEGLVRPTNDMLAEGRGSLPFLNNYLDADGVPIPANEVNSLAEDGIRSYGNSGSVLVENSVVRKMRGGIRLYLASSATVINSTAIDCGAVNFNMPRGGTVINSGGNFTNGPLNDFRLSRSDQNLEITILPSPNAVGSHNIADILGNNHDLVFHRADGPEDIQERRVLVVSGNNSTIRNETEYGIVLESGTRGNTVISAGNVIDNGSNNVTRIDLKL